MQPLDQLATQLLVGTDRRPPDWPSADGELGALLGEIQAGATAPEPTALRLAGVLAVCADAGFLPGTTDRPPIGPCPHERLAPAATPELLSTLQPILDDGPDPLRALALRQLAAAQRLLPPRLLPRALVLALQQTWLRPLLPAVVGERGRWLARVNPEWQPALAADDASPDPTWWDEGTLEQRCRFLTARRRLDPSSAREQLAGTFGETDARGRARLLAELTTGLSLADEDFLEGCLKDRGKEVRQQAAALLACLPDSRYVARMGERVGACLGRARKLLRQVLTIEPPETFDPDWKKDAIDETTTQGERLGQRAWWLYQLARALPLHWWHGRTGLAAADCVRWAKGTDWELALLRAWIEALARAPELAWTEALLMRLPIEGRPLDPLDLIERLPPAARETHWFGVMEDPPRGTLLGVMLGRIAQTLMRDGALLSPPIARRMLDQVRRQWVNGHALQDYSLRRTLPDFICCLPADVLAEAANGWPALPALAETLAQVLAVIRQRQTLIHHLQEGRTA
ncbi:DUF5691 domain-containing protein [uncultured Thiodictyon sp.]|uniref:DUF5691 domain-containing protein n=1 Tax=uncultured Thiodictyon sp. TaxID=1846217 RepID=UPI0025E5BF76|nr:DUF5691 domain-containing protein [uncultured Thiodictyon sp.]